MSVYMTAEFTVKLPVEIDLEENPDQISIGGFTVCTKDGEIPFDFDKSEYSICKEKGYVLNNMIKGRMERHQAPNPEFRVHYEGSILSECYDEDYQQLGLKREDITAEYLSKAEKLEDFFVMCWDENDNEIIPKIYVHSIVFIDENATEFRVRSYPLLDFSHRDIT